MYAIVIYWNAATIDRTASVVVSLRLKRHNACAGSHGLVSFLGIPIVNPWNQSFYLPAAFNQSSSRIKMFGGYFVKVLCLWVC